ncbi:MAG: hypothetical protein DRG39_01840, partial [Deltaproteobacteria bacterium]
LYAKVFILGGRNKRKCGIGARGLFFCSKSLGLTAPFRQSHPKNPLAPISLPVLFLYCIQIRQKLLRKVSGIKGKFLRKVRR